MTEKKSIEAFEKAKKIMPGGVNSPVRAFSSVGLNPPFISEGKGSKIYDLEGKEYIDYVCSWGPLILGHCHPQVVEAVKTALESGTSFGAPTEMETEMAELVTGAFPSMEMVRMVNSGTEATMTALRLARGFTQRDKILKFNGCYHGHVDSLLIKAGSGVTTLGLPDSPGVTPGTARDTISISYNDIDSLKEVFEQQGEEIAAVILEPVAGNMGLVLPRLGYLEFLRKITEKYGSLLIFDEVITGFRAAFGGAQEVYGVRPDLTCLGKIIGGGLPVGAYGGRREIMESMAPLGPVYQAGTLSGNPLAMSAGIAVLKVLKEGSIYTQLEVKTKKLLEGVKKGADRLGIPVRVHRIGSLFCVFFQEGEVWDFDTAARSDLNMFTRYFQAMLERGIYLAPSQFESGFVSAAHTEEDIERTIEAGTESLEKAARS
ncbi:glutamate-1-semialdehyde 2,1-aminomutase [Candidatus Contubernalis alkalaceticus]|uniref:glutamate-1-semialdehyde 2,1-aminomutase n=1 Tax=Candidatus Contubernalis alkaliaceticus TaxID=338645 RepID=UPI002A4E2DB1|nr:glutamate-1-semialdehyde 2,1-aminomutase [Candidatus Contubernalis alkalaceticus]